MIYHITPQAGTCTGLTVDYTVTVYPVPTLTNSPLSKTICNGASTNISLTSLVTGTLFTWTASGTAGTAGYSNNTTTPALTINQTLTNSAYTNGTVTYVVTPQANGCTGTTANYAVTVFPVPDLSNTPLSKQICNGMSTNLTLTSNVSGTLFTWTCSPGSANVTGYSDNLATPTVTLNQTLTNSGSAIETVTYHLTPKANGCSGTVIDYVVTVYPSPNLTNSPLNKMQCSNTATNIALTSAVTGTTFTWTCNPSSGNITGWANNSTGTTNLNQTLINSGSVNETVIYHITPRANNCDGSAVDYTVTVYPVPVLTNTPLNKSICTGSSTEVTLTSNVAGAGFTWTCTPSSGAVTGFAANPGPASTSLNQTLVNSGLVTESVVYHLTPVANGCTGTVTDFTVNVYPTADVYFTPSTLAICSQAQANLLLQSHVPGTTFAWTATGSSLNVSGYANGTGNTISQTLTNTGSAVETVTYLVTPSSSICAGTASSIIVTVYPTPHVSNIPPNPPICSLTPFSISLNSTVSGTTFTWTCTPSSGNITGCSSGSGSVINHTLTNSGTASETMTYNITPTANGCAGPVYNYIVTVSPRPGITNNPLTAQVCSGTAPNVNLTANIPGTTFSWTASGSSGNVTGFSASSEQS